MKKYEDKTKGQFLYHTSCPKCGSSDALAIYEKPDGRLDGYCWSCNKFVPQGEAEESEEDDRPKITSGLDRNKGIDWIKDLPIQALPDRGISEDACKEFGVRVSFDTGTGEVDRHYYPVYKHGKITGYKERTVATKDFISRGDTKGCEFFGQHLYAGGSRKLLIVVEGELDCLAAYDILKKNNKNYAVVSIPHGAASAKRNAQDALEWLESFENVVLMMDQDSPGQKAAKDIAELLTPGKAKIGSMSEKDTNDMLLQRKYGEWVKAVWNAKEYRPDGIIRLSQAWDEMWADDSIDSIPYPWDGLNDKLYGVRPREIVTITSGSGMGKSAIIRELEHWLFKKTEDNIGVLALEESIGRTQWGIVSVDASLPLHIREERKNVKREVIKQHWDNTAGTGRFISYDHFGSTSEENLITQVRYLIKGMDCKWIFLDHLSIVVSAMEDGGDERRTIDSIMTNLRKLIEETGAGLFLVSHLRRGSGDKGHEQGANVTLNQLRGSHSIAQLSDAVIGLERNQQADDPKIQNMTKIVVLKNRYAGLTGAAAHLYYAKETGRLYQVDDIEDFVKDSARTYKDLRLN